MAYGTCLCRHSCHAYTIGERQQKEGAKNHLPLKQKFRIQFEQEAEQQQQQQEEKRQQSKTFLGPNAKSKLRKAQGISSRGEEGQLKGREGRQGGEGVGGGGRAAGS